MTYSPLMFIENYFPASSKTISQVLEYPGNSVRGLVMLPRPRNTKRLSQVFFGQAPCTPGRSEVLWLCRLRDSTVPQRQGLQVVEGTIPIKRLHERTLG